MRQNHLPRSACLNAWGRVAQHEASGETQKISSQCGNMAHFRELAYLIHEVL